jgi:ATP-dependent Clp protease ATP-binding subunit ClpA
MITRLSADAKKVLLTSAQEARRRGDRRLGTDHLLLGLLHDADSGVAQALQIDLEAARSAADGLDRAALAAVGVNVAHLGQQLPAAPARRLPTFTSGARAVLTSAVDQTKADKTAQIRTRHLLLALLDRQAPDPGAELLAALGVDGSQVRMRLEESSP